MTKLIKEHAEELRAIARGRSVRRLTVFGSALTDEFDALPPVERANAYFGLLADLEALFARPVDLVERSALRNPIVREAVEASQVIVYDAA